MSPCLFCLLAEGRHVTASMSSALLVPGLIWLQASRACKVQNAWFSDSKGMANVIELLTFCWRAAAFKLHSKWHILLGFEMEASPWVYLAVVAAKYHLFWVDCAFSSLQVLKHLTLKRPVEASRMDFFAHAEAFAALVSLEFVSISGKPACSSCLFLALQT